jgi:hypothetical protein
VGWKLAKQVYESALPTSLKSTAAAIAMLFADEDGGSVRPSIERIGWVMSKSARSASTDVNELRKLGILVPLSSIRGGRNRTTRYRFNADALPVRPTFESLKQRSALRGLQAVNNEADFVVSNDVSRGNNEADFVVSRSNHEVERFKPRSSAYVNHEAGFVGSVIDQYKDQKSVHTPRAREDSQQHARCHPLICSCVGSICLDRNQVERLVDGRVAHPNLRDEARQRFADFVRSQTVVGKSAVVFAADRVKVCNELWDSFRTTLD